MLIKLTCAIVYIINALHNKNMRLKRIEVHYIYTHINIYIHTLLEAGWSGQYEYKGEGKLIQSTCAHI
jgi:hypothetical protein